LENYIQEIRNNIVADHLVKQGVLREDDLISCGFSRASKFSHSSEFFYPLLSIY
jgi:hypothetical protein